jgi:hypothetical protein
MRAYILFPLVLALLMALSCASPPAVVQGKVVQSNPEIQTLLVSDETAPEKVLEISIAGADIGAEPNPGDVVRVAYHTKDGKLIATRIMNISRQKDLNAGK